SRRLGAARIILLSRHADRQAIGRTFGATDVVAERGDEAIAKVLELTNGGADAVLECVGSQEALNTAIGIARPGGAVGYGGVPHGTDKLDIARLFGENIALNGGIAPVRAYLPDLLAAVLAGQLDPGPEPGMVVDGE